LDYFQNNIEALSELILYLEKHAVGFLTESEFEILEKRLKAISNRFYIDKQTTNNFIRIFESSLEKKIFLKNCVSYPHYLEIAIGISAYSDYLTGVISLNPEYFFILTDLNELKKEIDEEKFYNYIISSLKNYKKLETKLKLLRLAKRREILKIGARDILGLDSLEKTLSQISILAKVLLKVCFEICVEEIDRKYELKNKIDWKYALCSLGKLGGGELNYSSDVDLLLFYEKDYKIEIKDSTKYYSELLSETAQLFVKFSSENTDYGYLYRVDFRLRPEGKYSPICGGVWDYINYYEKRGELWERQMLLKLDFVCGDKSLYNFFYKFVRSYVFNQSLFLSPFEQVAKMKYDIEKKVKEKKDVKLFSGGIRDIEFSVQALQLVYGKEDDSLKTSNTLKAIAALSRLKKLAAKEAIIFAENYAFYRKIEHYLQLMNDIQTHEIPQDDSFITKMAFYFQFENAEDFWKTLNQSRAEIKSIFNSIVGQDYKNFELKKINFKDLKKAERNYNFLKTGKDIFENKSFDKSTSKAFEKIENNFWKLLKNFSYPDIIIEAFAKIVRSFIFPSQLYNFLDDEFVLESFMRLCAFSQLGVYCLTTEKFCQDLLLSGTVFLNYKNLSLENLNDKQILFYLSYRFANDMEDELSCSKILSEFVEAKIKKIAINYENFGNYFIAGLGSFGSCEMTFGSDIDLLIIASDECNFEKAQEFGSLFCKFLANEFLEFKFDLRLRPEGKSSQMVWTFSEAVKYLKKRSRIWELQALTKLRFICGDKILFDSFLMEYANVVKSKDKNYFAYEIDLMRKKLVKHSAFEKKFHLKRDFGGLLDAQFGVQYIFLKNIEESFTLIGTNLYDLLMKLSNWHKEKELFNKIAENYRFLKKLDFAFQSYYNKKETLISLDKNKPIEFIETLNMKTEVFFVKLQYCINENFLFYKKILSEE